MQVKLFITAALSHINENVILTHIKPKYALNTEVIHSTCVGDDYWKEHLPSHLRTTTLLASPYLIFI